jgi:hypothetical protein
VKSNRDDWLDFTLLNLAGMVGKLPEHYQRRLLTLANLPAITGSWPIRHVRTLWLVQLPKGWLPSASLTFRITRYTGPEDACGVELFKRPWS